MLARSSWRISAATAVHRRLGSSAAALRSQQDLSEPDLFGQEYGAGPSRLPYTPPARPAPFFAPAFASASQSSFSGPGGPLPHFPQRRTRDSASRLRKRLAVLPPGAFSTPTGLMDALFADSPSRGTEGLSPLEQTVILHHLIRRGTGSVAVGLAISFLELSARQPQYRRRHYSRRTLVAFGNRRLYRLAKARSFRDSTPPDDPLVQPCISEQQSPPVSRQLGALIDFLDLLQRVRHPRPERLYELVIRQCINQKRQDQAAKIYVGLVEEWILEGRIAEGASPKDFYRGGGPPRSPPNESPLHRMWFSGVRTWRLPGEALSLHDRLDLWHPLHHAADERLRGFPLPMPTSPPSLVPLPALSLLIPIVDALALDPYKTSVAEYAASMRALATLANTILSRTLPIPAIPKLLRAFSQSRILPAVYPESLTEIPEESAWAYTANTQVHVAMVSLLFSPPNYARAAQIEREFKLSTTAPMPWPTGPQQYGLHPLSWLSCVVLIRYASEQLVRPRMLSRLLSYMRDTFYGWSTDVYNSLFRGSTMARDDKLQQQLEDSLFADTALANVSHQQARLQLPQSAPEPVVDLEDTKPVADLKSIATLVTSLSVTSRWDRLEQVVYSLIPFLGVSSATTPEDLDRLRQATAIEFGARGRPLPTDLPPDLYLHIVAALAKGGRTGLAQRLFFLARDAERKAVRGHQYEFPGMRPPIRLRLPMSMFTCMLTVYGAEANRQHTSRPQRVGWKASGKLATLPRRSAAMGMAWDTYRAARSHSTRFGYPEQRLAPDEQLVNAAIRAFARSWSLDDADPLSPAQDRQLRRFLCDVADFGFVPPPGLKSKVESGAVQGDIYLPLSPTPSIAHTRVYRSMVEASSVD